MGGVNGKVERERGGDWLRERGKRMRWERESKAGGRGRKQTIECGREG